MKTQNENVERCLESIPDCVERCKIVSYEDIESRLKNIKASAKDWHDETAASRERDLWRDTLYTIATENLSKNQCKLLAKLALGTCDVVFHRY